LWSSPTRLISYAPVDDRQLVLDAARPVLTRMALLSYGSVQVMGRRVNGGDDARAPSGESSPMAEKWAALLAAKPTFETLDAARAELGSWLRRPLVPETTETLEELCARVVSDGWGITADECAVAMRCTPTLVRRARLAELRHPDTGRSLPERGAGGKGWALALDACGLSLRQIEGLTGVPKSTLHRILK
jgi:hypothetical protein